MPISYSSDMFQRTSHFFHISHIKSSHFPCILKHVKKLMLFIQLFLTNRPAGFILPATPPFNTGWSTKYGQQKNSRKDGCLADSGSTRKCRQASDCSEPGGGIQHFIFSDTSFSFISTRMISFPTWQISQKGIIYSFSLPRKPQIHPGPGTIRASMQPVSISKSTSPTKPRRLQVFTLITSFCLRS